MKKERTGSILKATLLMILTLFALSCQGPFTLNAALGLGLESLNVSPDDVEILISSTQDFTVTGGTAPFTWVVYSGNSSGDFLTPTNTATETFTSTATAGPVTIRVTDADGQWGQASIFVDGLDPVNILSGSGSVEINSSFTLFATGGDGSYTWSIDTDGSGGATISGGGGVYTAGPDAGFDVIRVEDGLGGVDTVNIIVVDSTAPLDLQAGNTTPGTGESQTLFVAGGVPPYTFVMATNGTGDSSVSPAGLYTAGSSAGVDTVEVTDADANTDTVVIGVVDTTPALSLTSGSSNLNTGDTITLYASGGVPPYTFDFQTNGTGDSSVTPATGDYTAGSVAGNDTVRVTDDNAMTATVNITVSVAPPADIDYEIVIDSVPTDPAVGSPMTGANGVSFTYSNIGGYSDAGNTISISAYVSESTDLSGDVTKIGDLTGLTGLADGGSSSEDLDTLAGNWPATSGNYYIILLLSALTDTDSTNNDGVSAVVNVQPLDIYHVMQVAPAGSGSALTGGAVSDSFVLRNIGADDAGEDVTWTAWASVDGSISPDDHYLDANTISSAAMTAFTDSPAQPITGNWPETPGSYWILVEWDASDDTNATPNAASTGMVAVAHPVTDYRVDAINAPSGGTTAGSTVNFSFDVTNDASADDDPNAEFQWEIYASSDNAFSFGDVLIAEGNRASLSAGDSTNVSDSGPWPDVSGSYYLIARVFSDSEEFMTEGDNTLARTTPDSVGSTVDYEIINVQYHPLGMPGDARTDRTVTPVIPVPINESFDIHSPGIVGTRDVEWAVYASDDFLLDTGGDELVDFGTVPAAAIGTGGTFTVDFEPIGTWPVVNNETYHYIITINSPDDGEASNDFYTTDEINVLPVYVEGVEDNQDNGPFGGMPSSVSDTTGHLFGGELSPGEVLRIDGIFDAPGDFDTFWFITDTVTDQLQIELTWATGADSADLYFWDLNGYESTAMEIDPDNEYMGFVGLALDPWEDSMISVRAWADEGAAYTIYITAE